MGDRRSRFREDRDGESARRPGEGGRFECGDQCTRWGEDVGCEMHCGEIVCDDGEEYEMRECLEWSERGRW